MRRLDLHHEIMTELLGGDLYNAPIGDTPHMILDVGTGTGIWACEMAEKFPMAVVLGTDLRFASSNVPDGVGG